MTARKRLWALLALVALLSGAFLVDVRLSAEAHADDDPAPEVCDTAEAVGKARAALDWHDRHGSLGPMFWRILNTLSAENLPAKPAEVTVDTITAADVETYSDGKAWAGWTPIVDALKCIEKAAEDTDDGDGGSDTNGGDTDTSEAGAGADPAPAACDTAEAVGKARAALDWHDRHGSLGPMFWRILNTLSAENLPAKPAEVTVDTITAADVETYSDGKAWAGWTPIVDALKCIEKAAEDTDDGTGTDGQDSQDTGQDTQQSQQDSQQQDSVDTQQSQQDSQQQDSVDTQQSQQDQVACSLEWVGNGGSDTVTAREGRYAFSYIVVRGTATMCSANGFAGAYVCGRVQVGGNLQGQVAHANHVYPSTLGLWFDSTHTGTAPQRVDHAVGSRWGGDCSGSINWTEAASASGHRIAVRGAVEDDTVVKDYKVQFDIWAANNGGLRATPVLYMDISDNDTPCTGWDSSDITIGEDDYLAVKLGNTPAGCGDFDSTITLAIDVAASHNGTKPYRDGCTSSRYTFGDDVGVLGIIIDTKSGWLQASPCDDNTIVERQVVIRDTNPAGGAATKTITITDDDSRHPMQPTRVYVQRQSAVQNLPDGTTYGYDSTKTYAAGEKVYSGSYWTWTRNTRPLKNGGTQPAPGSEHTAGTGRPDTRGCRTSTSASDSQFCWDRSYVQYDSAGVRVQTGRAYYEPYRLKVFLSGAAHPTGSTSFEDDGTDLVLTVAADANGFTPSYAWVNRDVTCHGAGPGWVQVHVYRDGGSKFDTSALYRYGGDKIQICW